jgi:hypothetical protein
MILNFNILRFKAGGFLKGETKLQITTIKNASLLNADTRRLSIFDQPLWRGLIGRSAGYQEEVVSKHGVPVARLSYTVLKDRFVGMPWGLPPPLSCRNGPAFSDDLRNEDKPAVLRTLIKTTLGRHPFTSFIFTCDPYGEDAALVRQEFIRAGFEHTTLVNPVQLPDQPGLMVPHPSDDGAINKRRSHINNARGKLDIVEDIGPDEFIAFYDLNLKARNKTTNYIDPIARALIVEGAECKQVRILAARRKKSSPEEPDPPLDAAIVIAWDRPIAWDDSPETKSEPPSSPSSQAERCYLLLLTYRLPSPAQSQEKPHPDANKLLIMEAAHFAAKHGLIFDTGGSATPGAEKFYRQLFPRKGSDEFRDVFKLVKWHAGWYDKCKLACKVSLQKLAEGRLKMARFWPSRVDSPRT